MFAVDEETRKIVEELAEAENEIVKRKKQCHYLYYKSIESL